MNKSDPFVNWNIVILPVQFLVATTMCWRSKREMVPLNLSDCVHTAGSWSYQNKKRKITCPELHVYTSRTVNVLFINPRRACAARVTVVVLCVCLSVCPNTLFWQYAQLEV